MNNTITEGLRPYALGEKLRTLRLRKSMGLVELGKHTGLSAAMLSKLERGKLSPLYPRCYGSPWCSVSGLNEGVITPRIQAAMDSFKKTFRPLVSSNK